MSEPPPAAEGRARRAPGMGWRDLPDGTCARVLRIDPPDGASGVFHDTPIVATFSRPADPRTVSVDTFAVLDDEGAVPGAVWTSADGRVAVWTPGRLLAGGRLHCVRLAGLRDVRGHELSVHESAFVPGGLAFDDLGP